MRVPIEEETFHCYLKRELSCPEVITINEPVKEYPQKCEDSSPILEDHCSSTFPTKLLKPNFIVDLMDCPGDLLPIGSNRARLYCEKKLACDTVC